MSEQKLLHMLKTETDVVVNNNITKRRMIDILDLHYSIIHMQRYLDRLNEYFKDVSACAQSRESHYRECIMTKKWKKGKEEDEKHRHWRTTFNELAVDCEATRIKWSNKLLIIEYEFERQKSKMKQKSSNNNNNEYKKKKKKKKSHKRLVQLPKKNEGGDKFIEVLAEAIVDGFDERNPDLPVDFVAPKKSDKEKKEDGEFMKKVLLRAEIYKQRKKQKDMEDDKILKEIEKKQKYSKKIFFKNFNNQNQTNYNDVNIQKYINDLKQHYSSLNEKDSFMLKPYVAEIIHLPLRDEEIDRICQIFVCDLNVTNREHLLMFLDSLLLNGPDVTKEDLSIKNAENFWNSKRNLETDNMSRPKYVKFVYYLSQYYITQSIEKTDAHYNEELLYRIVSLYNIALIEFIGGDILSRRKLDDRRTLTDFDFEFVGVLQDVISARVGMLADALLQHYVPFVPKSCFALEYFIRNHTKWMVEQSKNTDIVILFTNEEGEIERWKFKLIPNDKGDEGNKMMNNVIKAYKDNCKQ